MATLSQEALNKLASAFGQGVANEMASLGNKAAALASTPPFGSAYTQTYSTATHTHSDLTAADLTDNTTGTATTTLAAGAGVFTVALYINLATLSNADQVTNYTPGYKFKLLAVDFVTHIPATTADKLSTINLEIGDPGTNVTGGAVALTTAGCDTRGKLVAGSAITAANTGTSTDVISVEASSTTAFVEGSGWLLIKIQNMDTADAIASIAAQCDKLLVDLTNAKQVVNGIIDDLQAGSVVT